MDFKNIIIDRVIDGVAEAHGEILFRLNQITNPSLSCSSESTDAVDALGIPITTFYRAKTAEFTAENALLDLDLAAAQFGTERIIASAAKTVITPRYETLTVADGVTEYTLEKEPLEPITAIYALSTADGLGEKYTSGAAATGNEFIYDAETHKITIPEDIAAGTQLFVKYEYASEVSNEVKNTATNFPQAFKFTLRVLCCDACDPTTLRIAYVIFPNAKLSPDAELSFTTDATHNFTINCQTEYCDKEKRLFSIVVDED